MTSQGPGGLVPPGGQPPDDETRADWPVELTPEPATAPPAPPPAPVYAPPLAYAPTSAPTMAWAPPPVTGPGAAGLEYAGALPRFVAYLVDGLVLALIGLGLWLLAALVGVGLFANLSGVTSSGGFDSARLELDAGAVGVSIVIAVIGAAISAAYFVLQWSGSKRATLGMRVLGLQMGNAADGRTITREAAFRRWIALGGWTGILTAVPMFSSLVNLAVFVWELILLGSVITSPTKQGLHDRFAGTVIVQPAGGSGNGLIVGCLVIIAALAVMFVLAFVALIFLGTQVSAILSDVGQSV
jgi:uncharacterized RDD family membrane protein YckC